MFPLVFALTWAGAVASLLARTIMQFRHYRAVHMHDLAPDDAPEVTVIVPARNEARTIGVCVGSLLAQDYPRERMKIVVVDDNSTDGTADAVGAVQAGRREKRVDLVHAPPLPSGWTGKSHACWLGVGAAQGEWLCFVDADTVSRPALSTGCNRHGAAQSLDMLSLEPFQVLGTFWERLLIPCGFFLAALVQDLRRINDPAFPDAAANGQFILVRRSVYESIGGHRAVRSEIAEDTALARLLKRSGHRLGLLGAEDFIQTRMYTGLRTLWEGVSKNLVVMAGGRGPALVSAAAAPAPGRRGRCAAGMDDGPPGTDDGVARDRGRRGRLDGFVGLLRRISARPGIFAFHWATACCFRWAIRSALSLLRIVSGNK